MVKALRRTLIRWLARNDAFLINVNLHMEEDVKTTKVGVSEDTFALKKVNMLRLELPKGASFHTINSSLNEGRFERIERKVEQYRAL